MSRNGVFIIIMMMLAKTMSLREGGNIAELPVNSHNSM